MANLDAEQIFPAIDPGDMGGAIERFPAQAQEAWRLGQDAHLPLDYGRPANVVIHGMGGSAIGGDLLRSLYAGQLPVPALVVRDYALPAFIGSGTFFIASSYSGNTEETLAGYAEARRRGCKVMAIASGGELIARAKSDGYPHIVVPGGMQPRAALGYSFFPLLAVFGHLGLIPDPSEAMRETIIRLDAGVERLRRSVPCMGNPAKDLAQWLYGSYPLIYAAGTWPGVVAMRWKGQLNENAKNLAFWNVLPELNHNETVGFEAPADLVRAVRLVFLLTGVETIRVAKRIEVTAGIIARAGGRTREVRAEGQSELCRMFSLIQHGDFVSYYLAMLNGADPTPVRVIQMLKGELAKLDEQDDAQS